MTAQDSGRKVASQKSEVGTARLVSDKLSHPQGTSIGLWLLASVMVVAGLGGLVTVGLLESFRFERLAGYVQAKAVVLDAPCEGRLLEVRATTGQLVHPGDVLFVIQDEKLDETISRQEAKLATLEKELAQGEARLTLELQERQRVIQQEVFETKLKSAAFLKQKFSSQVEQLAWKQVVEDLDQQGIRSKTFIRPSGFVATDREAERIEALLKEEAARNAHEVSSAQAEMCDERLVELERLSKELPSQMRGSIGLELLQQRLSEAREEMDRLQQHRKALTVSSSATGIVGIYTARVGEHVAAHVPLVQILDEDQPYLEVEIPSERINEFARGKVLQVQFPGGVNTLGKIESIPPQTSHSSGGRDSVVTAHVVPSGRLWPSVPFGTRVDILQPRGWSAGR